MNQGSLAPVVLFAYNRPEHTRRVLEALARNDLAAQSPLYIFCDGAKRDSDAAAVEAVRGVVREVTGFARLEVIESPTNKGLARSVISGVTEVVNAYGQVIVVEDDLLTAPSFLRFMNDCLRVYQDRPDVFSISGHCYPQSLFRLPKHWRQDVFLSYRNSTTGWATWADRWEKVDWAVSDYQEYLLSVERQNIFDRGGQDLTAMLALQMQGKIDSWGIRFTYAHSVQQAYALFPVRSFIDNIGYDGTGVHSNRDTRYRNDLGRALTDWHLPHDIQPDPLVLAAYRRVYDPSAWIRFKRLIKRILGREATDS